VAGGDGSVKALDAAAARGLITFYPQLQTVLGLTDSKCGYRFDQRARRTTRVTSSSEATVRPRRAARFGVNEHIIDARWQALVEQTRVAVPRYDPG